MARQQSVEQQLLVRDGMLIDPGCIRLINGFIGGYCHEEILHTGIYKDEPVKNKFAHIQEALQYVLVKLVGRKVTTKPLRSRFRRRDGRVV